MLSLYYFISTGTMKKTKTVTEQHNDNNSSDGGSYCRTGYSKERRYYGPRFARGRLINDSIRWSSKAVHLDTDQYQRTATAELIARCVELTTQNIRVTASGSMGKKSAADDETIRVPRYVCLLLLEY